MPQIELLDGKKITFSKSINGFDLTKKIRWAHKYIKQLLEECSSGKRLSLTLYLSSKKNLTLLFLSSSKWHNANAGMPEYYK